MRRSSRAQGLVVALTLSLLAVLAGCAPSGLPPVAAPPVTGPPAAAPSDEPSAPSPYGTASPAPPPSLDVDVYRTRSDPATGRIQISVENRGEAPITVVRAELTSPALETALSRDGDTVIPSGARRDLPVTLTSPLCPADDASLAATITVQQHDGTSLSTQWEASDRLGQWRAWLDAECFTAAVTERVDLSIERAPARDSLAGGVTARIGLTLVVRGLRAGSEPLWLGTIAGTPLLTPIAGANLATRTTAPDAGSTTRIPIDVAPARCDPHAIAEDKQGTLFPVAVTFGDHARDTESAEDSGRVIVAASDEVRAELYSAITSACVAATKGDDTRP